MYLVLDKNSFCRQDTLQDNIMMTKIAAIKICFILFVNGFIDFETQFDDRIIIHSSFVVSHSSQWHTKFVNKFYSFPHDIQNNFPPIPIL